MKKQILLLLLLISSFHLYAGNRTEQEMKEAASKALVSNTRRVANVNELKELLSLAKLKVYGYEKGGFAVVTKDERFESVIGVSSDTFNGSSPCGFKWWIETVNKNMQNSESKGVKEIDQSKIRRRAEGVSPLITTIWGQERPYNDFCTFTNNSSIYQCVTGCVATALAQIMNFHHFPICGTGTNSYNINYNNSFTITFAEDFSLSVYDWDNMLNDYSSYSNTRISDTYTQAVAKLMKDCGVATNTRYSDNTHGSSSSAYNALNALKTYFKYDNATQPYVRSNYERENWLSIIYEALDNGKPIFYCGTEGEGSESSGHAFVLNGYDSTGKVYINWGWDGRYNGYYDIDLLNPSNSQFNYNQTMIVAVPGTDETVLQTITISSIGSGSVTCRNGSQVRNNSQTFKVKDGDNIVLSFTPDIGCTIKKVKVNGTDVTNNVSNNQYELSNIQTAITVDVEFENDSMSISEYNTYITCGNGSMTKIQSGSSFTVIVKFSLTNSGNSSINVTKIIGKDPDTKEILFSLTDTDVNGELLANSDKNYSVQFNQDISKYPEFEIEYIWNNLNYAYFSAQNRILTIQSNDFGSIVFAGISVLDSTKRFSVKSGGEATIEILPNIDCELYKLTVNNSDVTSNISNNQYTINNINSNISVIALFDSNSEDGPTVDGHEYIDLGLSSMKKWSVVNYGANKPEETGSYIYYNSDVVKGNWGENWRMPTKEEIQELLDECEWTWTELNGMNGFCIKGPNGNTMFLPAAGYYDTLWSTTQQRGNTAYYLTSTKEPISSYTWILKANSSSKKLAKDILTSLERYSIRPILNTYNLTYMVDGEVYKMYVNKKGDTIVPEPEPEPINETYIFSGWSEIPETMPAYDIVVTGTFSRYFDVGNLTKIVNFIMCNNASAEDIVLYDLNSNEKLDIGDVILIVKFILNNSNDVSNYVGRRVGEIAYLNQYTAAQFEVKTAGNVDIRLVKSMKQTHQLMYQQKDANTYAVVVYSLSNQLMQPENGKIIETDNDSDILSIENVTVATPTGETSYYQTLPATTGIEQIDNDNGNAVIYDLKGNRLNAVKKLEKGVYIFNGKKIITK